MTLRSISGKVLIDSEQVGSISGTYKDDSANGSKQVIEPVSIPITVNVNNEQIGNGSMSYQDYVTYNGGGSRTVDISGNVLIDNDVVGNASATLIDDYGKVIPVVTSYGGGTHIPWWIILIGIILILLLK